QWHSHANLPKTVIDLLGLGKFGVPRVDHAPSLAGRVDATLRRPKPPAFGSQIVQPRPPKPAPRPVPPAPWAGPHARALPDLIGNHGKRTPAPREVLGGAHIGASLEECVAKQWRSSFTYCPEAVVSPTCGPRPCLCRKDDGSLAHDHAGQASQAKDRAGATRAWDQDQPRDDRART